MTSQTTTVALSTHGVSAAYGAATVLASVDLELPAGRVTALLGANGAGKSTLIKVLSGAKPDHGGTVRVDGEDVALTSPAAAMAAGVQTVHQKVADGVVGDLTVAENLVLGDLAGLSGRWLRRRADVHARARDVLARLGLEWSEDVLSAPASRLGVSDAQLVVVARVIAQSPRVLVLDEPTSALSRAEAERLFAVVRHLRDQGLAVLYVSHRLAEVEQLADRVLVMRDGDLVLAQDVEEPGRVDWDPILTAMLGRSADALRPSAGHRGTSTVLRVRGLTLHRDAPPLDLDVAGGEVLGVLGLIGAGKTELVHALVGLRDAGDARLELDGEPYRPSSVRDALARGVVHVPEDRQAWSITPGWSVQRHASLPFLRSVSPGGVLSGRREAGLARTVVDAFGVRAPGLDAPIEDLSGGNQQKLLVGRWLLDPRRVVLLDEPFRGVDLGSRYDLSARIRDLTRQPGAGAAVVLSSDVEEVLGVADRIVVLVDGRVALDVRDSEADEETLLAALVAPPSSLDPSEENPA